MVHSPKNDTNAMKTAEKNNAEKSLGLNNLTNNLCLYYSILVDDIYQHLMDKALAAGHRGLKLSHALILPQISSEGTRIVDIAKLQNVSKQAIGQVANELENLGYISRTDDPRDKRSKKLILTEQGVQLIRQAASFMTDVDTELRDTLGETSFHALKTHSYTLFKNLSLKYPDAGTYTPEIANELPLIVHATSLATRLDVLLQGFNAEKGHTPLKRSYWQVLEKITQHGVRINDLAELNGISKQAISQLANEIEKAGYIARSDDPSDKRAKNLFPTKKGLQLISDTFASTQSVESLIERKIGSKAVHELKQAFQEYLLLKTSKNTKLTGTEDKVYNLLAEFINKLGDNEKSKWLDSGLAKRKLTPYALDKIGKMEF